MSIEPIKSTVSRENELDLSDLSDVIFEMFKKEGIVTTSNTKSIKHFIELVKLSLNSASMFVKEGLSNSFELEAITKPLKYWSEFSIDLGEVVKVDELSNDQLSLYHTLTHMKYRSLNTKLVTLDSNLYQFITRSSTQGRSMICKIFMYSLLLCFRTQIEECGLEVFVSKFINMPTFLNEPLKQDIRLCLNLFKEGKPGNDRSSSAPDSDESYFICCASMLPTEEGDDDSSTLNVCSDRLRWFVGDFPSLHGFLEANDNQERKGKQFTEKLFSFLTLASRSKRALLVELLNILQATGKWMICETILFNIYQFGDSTLNPAPPVAVAVGLDTKVTPAPVVAVAKEKANVTSKGVSEVGNTASNGHETEVSALTSATVAAGDEIKGGEDEVVCTAEEAPVASAVLAEKDTKVDVTSKGVSEEVNAESKGHETGDSGVQLQRLSKELVEIEDELEKLNTTIIQTYARKDTVSEKFLKGTKALNARLRASFAGGITAEESKEQDEMKKEISLLLAECQRLGGEQTALGLKRLEVKYSLEKAYKASIQPSLETFKAEYCYANEKVKEEISGTFPKAMADFRKASDDYESYVEKTFAFNKSGKGISDRQLQCIGKKEERVNQLRKAANDYCDWFKTDFFGKVPDWLTMANGLLELLRNAKDDFNSLDLVDEVREIETMIAKDNWAKSLVDILEVSTVQYLRLDLEPLNQLVLVLDKLSDLIRKLTAGRAERKRKRKRKGEEEEEDAMSVDDKVTTPQKSNEKKKRRFNEHDNSFDDSFATDVSGRRYEMNMEMSGPSSPAAAPATTMTLSESPSPISTPLDGSSSESNSAVLSPSVHDMSSLHFPIDPEVSYKRRISGRSKDLRTNPATAATTSSSTSRATKSAKAKAKPLKPKKRFKFTAKMDEWTKTSLEKDIDMRPADFEREFLETFPEAKTANLKEKCRNTKKKMKLLMEKEKESKSDSDEEDSKDEE